MQLALWFGFRELYFLGFEQHGGYVYDPDAIRTHQGYQMERHVRYYRAIQRCAERARAEIEAAGGTLADCTPDGYLTGQYKEIPAKAVLPYKRFEELL